MDTKQGGIKTRIEVAVREELLYALIDLIVLDVRPMRDIKLAIYC